MRGKRDRMAPAVRQPASGALGGVAAPQARGEVAGVEGVAGADGVEDVGGLR